MSTHIDELDPIEPREALELFMDKRRSNNRAPSTLTSNRSHLRIFIQWLEGQGLTNLNELTGRDVFQYRQKREHEDGLAPASLKGQISTIRMFLQFCEEIEALPQDFHRKVDPVKLNVGEEISDVAIDIEEAEAILDHLQRFEYASQRHVTFALLWHTDMRTGALHSLDIDDIRWDDRALRLRHRPDTGTTLKNKERSERMVAVGSDTLQIVEDWLAHNRPDTTDEYGREPLIASQQGRAHKSTIRQVIYNVTRPCYYQNECPHGREPTEEGCEAIPYHSAGKCPTSVAPHAIRKGSLTRDLANDLPIETLSERADVTPRVLRQHYDTRTEKTKMEQRRDVLGLD
ncbi:site-specific integrase [Natronomonas salina]|uniref:tyrosine-type recombinase/integrase n=1 Tax=Natronomonas salina TaxID=1710540 RepID=UPI0015B574B9|nr:tyrosine-type recombinase/integrase [Natronomonas salina]QLD89192.1 site-specific integrase [Natronomonas salina]